MPFPRQIDTEILLRREKPGIPGIFCLCKTEFISYPSNHEYSNRCDNYSFSNVRLTKGTSYEDHAVALYTSPTSSVTLTQKEHGADFNTVKLYNNVIDCAPEFSIIYLEFMAISKEKSLYDVEKQDFPFSMWVARSIFQLLKNMREWQFAYENLDSMNPMAIYSNRALQVLNPPQNIIDEIDSWPDMHLSMFIKGNPDYKKIPHPYPEPSEDMENWILEKSELHKKQDDEQILNKFLNP